MKPPDGSYLCSSHISPERLAYDGADSRFHSKMTGLYAVVCSISPVLSVIENFPAARTGTSLENLARMRTPYSVSQGESEC